MSKISIKAILHNITEDKYFSNDLKGIKNDNIIKFIDEDVTVVLNLNEDKINLKRRTEEYNIYMPFELNKKTIGSYEIKNLGKLRLEVNTELIDIKENSVEIVYSMLIDGETLQKFNYKIEYEEI